MTSGARSWAAPGNFEPNRPDPIKRELAHLSNVALGNGLVPPRQQHIRRTVGAGKHSRRPVRASNQISLPRLAPLTRNASPVPSRTE
jgi:hypothetical protein